MRFALLGLVLATSCGGLVEEAEPMPRAVPQQEVRLAEVSGAVTRMEGGKPPMREPRPEPAASRVVLVKPIPDWRRRSLRSSDVVAETSSSPTGEFVLRAPPGRYMLFAFDGGDDGYFRCDTMTGRSPSDCSPDIDIVLDRPARRDLWLYSVDDPW